MSLKDYVIAIPSYKRPDTLKNQTLRVLKEQKMDPIKIHIFVADKEQKKEYENVIDKKDYHKMIIGKPGIKNIRNFMAQYFKEGQYIVYIDDDIYKINETVNPNANNKSIYNKKNNKMIPLKSLKKLIEQAFKLSEKTKITNWGVYPVDNPYFMKPTCKNVNEYVSTKLCYIIGYLTGVINNKKCEIRTIDDKEDYERSIKYYLKDNGVLRFNNICCYTKCYKEVGGMQVERTKQRIHDSAVYLTKQYPELCTLNLSKKSGFSEVRMRDKRKRDFTYELDKHGIFLKLKNENLQKTKKKTKVKTKSKKKKYIKR